MVFFHFRPCCRGVAMTILVMYLHFRVSWSQVPCDNKELAPFESVLLLDLVGESPENITETELEVLEDGFVSVYNLLTTASCGPFSLYIEDVSIEREVNPGLVRRMLRDNGRRRFLLRSFGRCRGCRNRGRLFNDDEDAENDDRRRRLVKDATTSIASTKHNASATRGTRELHKNRHYMQWFQPQTSSSKRQRHNRGKGHRKRKKRRKKHGKRNRDKRGKGKGGRRKNHKRGRSGCGNTLEPSESDPFFCDCPSPPLDTFLDAYNEFILFQVDSGLLVNVNQVDFILELDKKDCTQPISEFNTDDVFVEYCGTSFNSVTQQEIAVLEQAFVETFNSLNALSSTLCDSLFRVLDRAPIILLNRRLGQNRFTHRYRPTGRCRGCPSFSRIFQDAVDRRVLLSVSQFPSEDRLIRNLQTMETCYCSPEAEQRVPTIDEFAAAFNETVKDLREAGVISNVDSVESVVESLSFPPQPPPPQDPEGVYEVVPPGGQVEVIRNATAGASCGPGGTLGAIDLCFLTDLGLSFRDDLVNLKAEADNIFTGITDMATSARLGLAGYVDYDDPFPYKLISQLSFNRTMWRNAINSLNVAGGAQNGPQSQYDAIVGSVEGLSTQGVTEPGCQWSINKTVARLLAVTSDSPFKTPSDGPLYSNDFNSTLRALNNANILVVGLQANGAGPELDNLAAATGGITQALAQDGNNVDEAILTALLELPCLIVPIAVGCGELEVDFVKVNEISAGDTVAVFSERYVPPATAVSGTIYICGVQYYANGRVVDAHNVTIIVA